MPVYLRKKYSPFYCGYPSGSPEYFELRWDVMGCILGCHFCWSPASRPEETHEPFIIKCSSTIFTDTRKSINFPQKTFIRFTGGEPAIYWEDLVKVFQAIGNDDKLREIPILIQTNGILFGRGDANLSVLAQKPVSKLRFLFELSFKGTNTKEFEVLTGRSGDFYEYQLNAYSKFLEAQRNNSNLSFVSVLGIYHSAIHNHYSKYAFVDPKDGTVMFDRRELWHPKFEKIWRDSKIKWVEPLRMSPKGVWKNLWRRCGDDGLRILRYFPEGAYTNPENTFPAKPKSYEYARSIVHRKYWQT